MGDAGRDLQHRRLVGAQLDHLDRRAFDLPSHVHESDPRRAGCQVPPVDLSPMVVKATEDVPNRMRVVRLYEPNRRVGCLKDLDEPSSMIVTLRVDDVHTVDLIGHGDDSSSSEYSASASGSKGSHHEGCSRYQSTVSIRRSSNDPTGRQPSSRMREASIA